MVGAKDPGFELRFSPFIWGFGGDYLTPDLKHSALDCPETIKGFKYYVELAQKEKVVAPGALKNTPQMSRMQLADQQSAMKVGSGWTVPIVDDFNPDLKAYEVLEMAPLPIFQQPVTSAWLSAWVMSSDSKHPEEAWELIKFITSREMELKWFRDNRVLSSRKDVSNTASEILNDKFARVISSQLPNARLVPQIKQWPEIIQAVSMATYDAINETKTPEEALHEAHLKVEAIMNRNEDTH
jgi:multiple sugar transport system substrate-binding protein